MDRFDTAPRVRLNKLPKNPEQDQEIGGVKTGRFPSWLHRKLPKGGNLWKTDKVIEDNRLHTVCEEAKCPNLFECWSRKTATFLAMGKECTRACGFCDIDTNATPKPLDPKEPDNIADSVEKLGLKHVVITMVARDDLADGGADHLAKIIRAIRTRRPEATIEVLTADFCGNWDALDIVLAEVPEVFNYNIETVRALTPRVRHRATYDRTLELLSYVREHGKQRILKSGIMVGLGETEEQVYETLRDLHGVGIDTVTMGQYLQPNRKKLVVKEFVTPDQFDVYADYGRSIGIKNMYCGPFVRSSYNADAFV